MPELEAALTQLAIAVGTVAMAAMTVIANMVLAKIKERTALESEALNRDALHKALKSNTTELVMEAAAAGELPADSDSSIQPAQAQKILAKLPAKMQETNPQTVAHFAGITGATLIGLAIQYLPGIFAEIAAMKKGPIRLATATIEAGPPDQAPWPSPLSKP